MQTFFTCRELSLHAVAIPSISVHYSFNTISNFLWGVYHCYDHLGNEKGFFPPTLGFPGGSDGKESAYNAGDVGLTPGLGISPGEGNGPLQSSFLENSMDRGYNPWGLRVRHDWMTNSKNSMWIMGSICRLINKGKEDPGTT